MVQYLARHPAFVGIGEATVARYRLPKYTPKSHADVLLEICPLFGFQMFEQQFTCIGRKNVDAFGQA